MKPDVRLFTSAHELGHILLHPQLKEAHRDRPLDGSVVSRTQMERAADRFASSYLMPIKLVRERFFAIFGTEEFVLSESTAFALLRRENVEARRQMRNIRGLSRRWLRQNALTVSRSFLWQSSSECRPQQWQFVWMNSSCSNSTHRLILRPELPRWLELSHRLTHLRPHQDIVTEARKLQAVALANLADHDLPQVNERALPRNGSAAYNRVITCKKNGN
jgi:Zn-dependent peptidase ImmA (M78 family)